MRRFSPALLSLIVVAMPSFGTATAAAESDGRAVVIVSGGDATSPFTTPSVACASGLAAGNTDTALRQYLLEQGHTVYTSPAMAGRGPVVDQDGFGAFGDCPITLPENMTVNSTGSIDTAGEHLARFFDHLHTAYGVDEIDIVGHSMGGLYSRAAIRVLQGLGSPIQIRSLTTIGTPWQGSYLSDYANGITPRSDCLGDAFCEAAMDGMKTEVERLMAGSGREVNQAYLMGPDGWNEYQAGVLDQIPVTLIGGNRFTAPDGSGPPNPAVWPNDGLVATSSALATDISDRVLPQRRTVTFDDTHSIFVSDANGLPWETGLTWDRRVLQTVNAAVEDS
ncbi:alpha/beta hydrolase [Mycolicibacterium frederiksbergense]|uniref:Alpha/beta hydrolase n=2 Tax=Mycolicibacterium frederiksbergense TaxID=117567 RepID=A0A6H0S0A0_9MYCO|nr:alpha/beta hydrolase [Mycolicibacterium frederiksbergense]